MPDIARSVSYVCPFDVRNTAGDIELEMVLNRAAVLSAIRTDTGIQQPFTPWDEIEVAGALPTDANRMLVELSRATPTTHALILSAGCLAVVDRSSVMIPARVLRRSGSTLLYDSNDTTRYVIKPERHNLPANRQSYLTPDNVWQRMLAWLFPSYALGASIAPSTPIIDDCNPSDTAPLTGSPAVWASTEIDGGTQSYSADGTTCTGSGSGVGGGVYSSANYAESQEIYYTIVTTVAGTSARLYVRASGVGATTWDGYLCRYVVSTPALRNVRVTDNVETLLGSNVTFTFDADDKWHCAAIAGTIYQSTNDDGAGWVAQNIDADATYTGVGAIGFNVVTAGWVVKDIGGGSLSSNATIGVRRLLR